MIFQGKFVRFDLFRTCPSVCVWYQTPLEADTRIHCGDRRELAMTMRPVFCKTSFCKRGPGLAFPFVAGVPEGHLPLDWDTAFFSSSGLLSWTYGGQKAGFVDITLNVQMEKKSSPGPNLVSCPVFVFLGTVTLSRCYRTCRPWFSICSFVTCPIMNPQVSQVYRTNHTAKPAI